MSEPVIIQEITIVKRKGKCEDCHHGGVWKIAYADFMTAMMAFFLVMWLINASNEETRAQVASYFNPVKLVDSTAQPRGLNDKEGEDKSTEHKKKTPEKDDHKKAEEKKKKEEEKKKHEEKKNKAAEKQKGDSELFRSPVETLNKIAGGSAKGHKKDNQGAKGGTKQGKLKVHKYQDPFAPKTWEVLKVETEAAKSKRKPGKKAKKSQKLAHVDKPKKKIKAPKAHLKTIQKSKTQVAKLAKKNTLPVANLPKMPLADKEKKLDAAVKKQKRFAEIKQKLKQISSANGPQVEVSKNKQGLLVNLADDTEFGMFKVASAQPAKEMVLFMEKIAKILAEKPGKIIIRGHTDGRPFHSKDYDNWRLSTARAQIARYMLIRGGIKEERFARIEGYADRNLKIASKPFDARNRRIEILILD